MFWVAFGDEGAVAVARVVEFAVVVVVVVEVAVVVDVAAVAVMLVVASVSGIFLKKEVISSTGDRSRCLSSLSGSKTNSNHLGGVGAFVRSIILDSA